MELRSLLSLSHVSSSSLITGLGMHMLEVVEAMCNAKTITQSKLRL